MITYLEIRNQKHLMDFEGTSDKAPTEKEIVEAVAKRGYKAKEISVDYDSMQGFFRFGGEIADPAEDSRASESSTEQVRQQSRETIRKVEQAHGKDSDLTFSEDDTERAKRKWNAEADKYNQWADLSTEEQDALIEQARRQM